MKKKILVFLGFILLGASLALLDFQILKIVTHSDSWNPKQPCKLAQEHKEANGSLWFCVSSSPFCTGSPCWEFEGHVDQRGKFVP